MRFWQFFLVFLLLLGFSSSALSKEMRQLASLGGAGMQKALEVKGQSRGLTTFNLSKSEEEKINFVKRRHDYRPEIKSTSY